MWWGHQDDLVDELIANNAARPIPGMEKPDLSKFRITMSRHRGQALVGDGHGLPTTGFRVRERLDVRRLATRAL